MKLKHFLCVIFFITLFRSYGQLGLNPKCACDGPLTTQLGPLPIGPHTCNPNDSFATYPFTTEHFPIGQNLALRTTHSPAFVTKRTSDGAAIDYFRGDCSGPLDRGYITVTNAEAFNT